MKLSKEEKEERSKIVTSLAELLGVAQSPMARLVELGLKPRSIAMVNTKLDEARLWLAEAVGEVEGREEHEAAAAKGRH